MDNRYVDVKPKPEVSKNVVAQIERKSKKKNLIEKKNLMQIIPIVLVVLALGVAGFFYKQYQDVKTNPSQAISEKNTVETDQVLNSLKAVILIEETEKPTVARVESPDVLKKNNETFYKNIVKGDYIILYPTRAIIYRKDTNQIINMAPIVKSSDLKASEQPAPTTPPAGTSNTNRTTR
jgi:nitrogen regulatory protein PII-like uncharacterized protein